ncbi:hypothetical protein BGW36DRAFT_431193 [Talaromyces proteolyticus]|uniref:Protein kinase n=1 Tax=Talaromyces proteolyticus TaxID=1131652 RepID=A0AAD4KHK8_9EURO|nr:uncharacterized protein BGW36DRAFT_431193 [Talaromyces proteolyticus]KAH8691950.1 hypothetical protein BGW36DRAFT_431193 [Talaromyces proteolyticus]
MDVNPTQGSTQPYSDPRRMGSHNSGLQDEDVSDILCILHPGSPSAHELVDATARLDKGQQHILQRDEFEYDSDGASSRDIALRLSSSVKDLSLGFVFGRNPQRCDVLLSPEVTSRTISNIHFRIFVNDDGILMLQDMSTNGTVVDDTRLWKRNGQTTRMLVNGSVIIVASDKKEVRFVVRIPSRDGFNVQHRENMVAYIQRVARHTAKVKNLQGRTPALQPTLQWTLGNPYGMHWTGGSIYNVTGQIGKGAFATVYKLATKQDGVVYAAKELDKRRFMKNGILDQKVDNEMRIMSDLRHPNIVQYIDHHEHDRWIYIIMEYVACGELSTYLAENSRIAEDMVKSIARQLLHALQYLHKRKITHRDIKPDNILISSLNPLRVKLSDFGLSKSVQEETLLKTFCGTLLYCAPEVYPEYDNYRQGSMRKRRRLGDPPPRTSPYSQSVDMWSLGAVLFHILCGTPPFTGRADDRGAHMLRTIMTTEVEYDLLREAGISENGIDFVSQLLRREPHDRPTEKQLFKHAWIADVADIDEYSDAEISVNEEDGLPLITEAVEEELDASQLSIHDNFEECALSQTAGFGANQMKRPRLDQEASVRYPSLPSIQSFPVVTARPEMTDQRLFGEITPSALRSSGVFDGLGPTEFSFSSFQSSGESMGDGDGLVAPVHSFPVLNFEDSSPSLQGADSLVGHLNMSSGNNSPKVVTAVVDGQGTNDPVWHREVTPANEDISRSGNSSLKPNEVTPKAAPINRRIELPLPDTASESSFARDEELGKQQQNIPTEGHNLDELATTIDARTGKEVPDEIPASTYRETPDEYLLRSESVIRSIPRALPGTTFTKPLPLLGKLISVPGSAIDLTLRLESRMTSWGRGPYATVVHPDREDTRIPAYAIEVTFWSPGIEARIAAGTNWMDMPDVMAILSTKTRKCIWVNGVELRRAPETTNDKEAFHFGKLYTDDVITIFANGDQYLRFRCEFYHGDSTQRRPDCEKGFTVRQVLYPKNDSKRNQLVQPGQHDDDNKLYA